MLEGVISNETRVFARPFRPRLPLLKTTLLALADQSLQIADGKEILRRYPRRRGGQ